MPACTIGCEIYAWNEMAAVSFLALSSFIKAKLY